QLKTCQELMARFYGCLPPGGLLCLGFSETLWNIFDRFHSREVAGAYVYYKEALESPAPPAAPVSRPRLVPPKSEPRLARPHARNDSVSYAPKPAFHDHAG